MVRVIVEEELGDDVVGARIALRLQVIELLERVRRLGVTVGDAGDADADALPAIPTEALAFALDESDEVSRMAEVAERQDARTRGRIAA